MNKKEYNILLGIQVTVLVLVVLGVGLGWKALRGREASRLDQVQGDLGKIKQRLRIDQPTPTPKVKTTPKPTATPTPTATPSQ